ncbi:MAG: HD domain-containing protein [Thermomicrobiales bacterium]|nr:HD domain-containing protein [Thermomicrobiales bacterium]
MRSIAKQIRYRVGQGLSTLFPGAIAGADLSVATRFLDSSQLEVFRTMPVRDQTHHCCVASALLADGWNDRDVVVAALLHDIGKFPEGKRPSLAARAGFVLLSGVSPALVDRVTARARWWNRGLVLLARHSAVGAEIAAEMGCTSRVQELIARHGDKVDGSDPQLAALQRADGVC